MSDRIVIEMQDGETKEFGGQWVGFAVTGIGILRVFNSFEQDIFCANAGTWKSVTDIAAHESALETPA